MRVRFTRPARDDLDRIYDYISKDNPAAASRVVTRLIDRAMDLMQAPYQGREVDEPNARVIVVRAFATSSSTPSRAMKFKSPTFATRRESGRGTWSNAS